MSQMKGINSSGHRIPLNTFSNLSALLCQLAVSFFMAPFLIHRLGDSAYGIWAIVISIFGYMGLLDLGVSASLVRYVAQYDDESKRKAMGALLSSALVFYAGVGAIGALIGVAMGIFGMSVFNVPDSVMGKARLTMALMGLSLIIRFPGYVFTSLLAGMRLYYKRNVVRVSAILLKSAAIVVAITAGKGLVWLAIITVCGDCLTYFTIFLVARRHLHGVTIRIRDATKKCSRELVSYGLKVFSTITLRTISMGGDRLIIGIVLSSRWVTFFSIPLMLIDYVRTMLLSLTAALMPVFSNLQSQNQLSEIRWRVLNYSRYIAAIGLFAGAGLLAFGVPFVTLWMGPDYAARGATVLRLLCFSLMFFSLVACAERLFMGTGNQHILLRAAAVYAPTRLGLSIALICLFGIEGAALADFITRGGHDLYLTMWVARCIGVRYRDYVRQTVLRPIIATGAATLVLWGARAVAYPGTYLLLIAEVTLGCAVYLALAFMIVLTPSERKALSHFTRRFLTQRGRREEERLPAEAQAQLEGTSKS